ncbi:TPA: hypothetical protein ACT9I4_001960 [Legionella pneumophila]
MTTLVQSLQKQAIDESLSPSALLRRAKLMSKKLNLDDFALWIDNELNGYKNIGDLPEYRVTHGSLQGLNPYQGWKPIIIPEKEIEDIILAVHITQSIAEIEKLLLEKDSHGGYLEYKLSGAQEQGICKMINHQTNIRKTISKTVLDKIINNVKNIILDWSLKLEEEGITGSGIEFSLEEKRIAAASSNINIAHFSGILGNVTQSHINQHIVNSKNDLSELSSLLSSYGIEKDDIEDLKNCLQSDPVPDKPNRYGEKVSGWVGDMIKKAAMGTWKVSIDIATNILSAAINKYYGF